MAAGIIGGMIMLNHLVEKICQGFHMEVERE